MHVDLFVQVFALIVAAGTALLVGLMTALRLSRGENPISLREGSRGTGGVRRMRAWNLLVGAEVALAVVLLAGSALLIRSFARVMDSKLGFDQTSVYTVDVELPSANYSGKGTEVQLFHDHLLDRLRHLNGIQFAGLANMLPLTGNYPNGGMVIEGKPFLKEGRSRDTRCTGLSAAIFSRRWEFQSQAAARFSLVTKTRRLTT